MLRSQRIRSGSAAAVALFCLYGCSRSADFDEARKASDAFHEQMDRGQYATIYDSASAGFRADGDRGQVIALFAKVSQKMGKCEEAPAAIGAYKVTLSSRVVITMSSRSCANGKLDEQFAWQIIWGRAMLFKYKAISPLLLKN